MLISGIILTALGLTVFLWTVNARSKSFADQLIIFGSENDIKSYRTARVIKKYNVIILLICIGLFIGGLYSLWQVNPKIVLTITGICAVLWVFGYFTLSEKARAKKIFKIYRQLKLFYPEVSDEEIFRETTKAYFLGLRWNESKIRGAVELIFGGRIYSKEDKGIKYVASSILTFEKPYGDFQEYVLIESMKRLSKIDKAINDAYSAIIGNAPKVTERPELSKNTTEWIKSIGLNPDKMTNEQLTVFSEMDDPGKSNWAVKFFYGASFVFFISIGLSLISLEFDKILGKGFISFVLWYIGHKIQIRRINKKLYEANIMKYAQEQATKDE